jgi:L-threonylcarbamoyladenylate synthase
MSDKILLAASFIQAGKLVAFPTETVYGLGADALNPSAVLKIFELKERPAFDPLIIHISEISDLKRLVLDYDERISRLAERFWPGPLTLVLAKSSIVPDIVTSGLPTVAVRMPDNPIALDFIRACGCPIAAPSANKFGRVSPTSADHVRKRLKGVDYILDGGNSSVGIESTIIKLNSGGFEILRNGVITKEEIEKIIPYNPGPANSEGIIAPGMIKSHYSPDKPLFIIGETNRSISREKAGLLSFTQKDTSGYREVINVTDKRDLREYAVNLFAAIHKMEELNVEYIVVEPVPETGIGIAIMDRIRKAAYKYRI